MSELKSSGIYNVKIINALCEDTPYKNDKNAFEIKLIGYTRNNCKVTASLSCSNYKIADGIYVGLTESEKTCQILEQIGVEGGSPGMLPETIRKGFEADFLIEIYTGYNNWCEETNEYEVVDIFPSKNKTEIPSLVYNDIKDILGCYLIDNRKEEEYRNWNIAEAIFDLNKTLKETNKILNNKLEA